MGRMDDADAHGFVSNFARPGGNITGMSLPSGELSTKWLQFLIEILSPVARFAALWDTLGTANQVRLTEQAARAVGVDLRILPVAGPRDFTAAFAAAKQTKTQGLLILGSPIMTSQMEALAKLALEHGLAAVYTYREFTQAGGTLATVRYRPIPISRIAMPLISSTRSCVVQGRATCRLSNQCGMILPSTSRRPRRSASQSPQRCSTAPMRSLNKARHFRRWGDRSCKVVGPNGRIPPDSANPDALRRGLLRGHQYAFRALGSYGSIAPIADGGHSATMGTA